MCAFGYGLCLNPAISGWGLRCVFGWCNCLNPAIPGWGLWRVCLGTGFALTPPILARVCGVCVCVRVLSVPRQSWEGFVVCGVACGFCLHPANPGRSLCCVCWCAGSAFTPPIVAGVSGVCCWLSWVGPSPSLAEAHVGAVPRQSWLGLAAGFCGVVPRQSWLKRLWVQFPANLGWGLLLPVVGWSLANPC